MTSTAKCLRRLTLLFSVATAICVLPATSASALIYWGQAEQDSIGRASNDGTFVDPNFIHTGEEPVAVAVDAGHIYWADEDGESIGRAAIEGTAVENNFIAGIGKPTGVAVNGSSIYWDTLNGTIGRADLSGGNKQPSLLSGFSEPCGIALDAGHVYWVEIATGSPAYIARVGLDGNNLQLHYVTITGTSFPCGVAVNSSNIFWTDVGFFGGGTRIGRANTNTGEGVDPSLIGDASTPCGVAVDGSHLYWANAGSHTIARANTDATAVDESFIATGGGAICGVAVDGRPAPPGAQPTPGSSGDSTAPQTKIAQGPGKKLAQGKASFRFRANEPGSTFTCRLDKRKPKPCRSPKTYSGLKPGKHVFKVWATDAAGNKDPTPAKKKFRVPAQAA